MSIDTSATAQGLANLLFVTPNTTATLDITELAALAAAIDEQMSNDIAGFVAALPQDAANSLTQDQLNKAMAYVAMKRAGMA